MLRSVSLGHRSEASQFMERLRRSPRLSFGLNLTRACIQGIRVDALRPHFHSTETRLVRAGPSSDVEYYWKSRLEFVVRNLWSEKLPLGENRKSARRVFLIVRCNKKLSHAVALTSVTIVAPSSPNALEARFMIRTVVLEAASKMNCLQCVTFRSNFPRNSK